MMIFGQLAGFRGLWTGIELTATVTSFFLVNERVRDMDLLISSR